MLIEHYYEGGYVREFALLPAKLPTYYVNDYEQVSFVFNGMPSRTYQNESSKAQIRERRYASNGTHNNRITRDQPAVGSLHSISFT